MLFIDALQSRYCIGRVKAVGQCKLLAGGSPTGFTLVEILHFSPWEAVLVERKICEASEGHQTDSIQQVK